MNEPQAAEAHEARATAALNLRRQAGWCERLGSPLYGLLLGRAAEDVERGEVVWSVLEPHRDDQRDWSLPLRMMGAIHRLALTGRAPELATLYPSAGGELDLERVWPAFAATLEQHRDEVAELIRLPVQTNEVGRSAALAGGFLLVAQATGLPLRLLEVGASAGLNLRWDRYLYEAEGLRWGDERSPVRFTGCFEGRPPFDVKAQIAERAGCDARPLDPTSDEDALRLMSYVWPDQVERVELLRAALEVAPSVDVTVETAGAVEWTAGRLAEPRPGTATVVFHSIVLPYLAHEDRALFEAAVRQAGDRATPDAPLAWLQMETGEDLAEVRLRIWPDGDELLLAHCGYHGPPVRWLG